MRPPGCGWPCTVHRDRRGDTEATRGRVAAAETETALTGRRPPPGATGGGTHPPLQPPRAQPCPRLGFGLPVPAPTLWDLVTASAGHWRTRWPSGHPRLRCHLPSRPPPKPGPVPGASADSAGPLRRPPAGSGASGTGTSSTPPSRRGCHHQQARAGVAEAQTSHDLCAQQHTQDLDPANTAHVWAAAGLEAAAVPCGRAGRPPTRPFAPARARGAAKPRPGAGSFTPAAGTCSSSKSAARKSTSCCSSVFGGGDGPQGAWGSRCERGRAAWTIPGIFCK